MNVNTYVLSGGGLDRIVLKNGSVMTMPEVVAELNRLARAAATSATELKAWRELRQAVADIEGCEDDWPSHGNVPLALAAGYALLKRERDGWVESWRSRVELSAKVAAQRDAALSEVERLRQFERICEGLPQDAIDGGWTVQGIRGYAKRLEERLAAAEKRVAKLKREVAELEEELEEGGEAHTEVALRCDRAEKWADSLAGRVVALLGIDIGDHHSPRSWERAWLALGEALSDPLPPRAPEAWRDVLAERRRQVEIKGHSLEGDDGYISGQLAAAAACYALWAADVPMDLWERLWPWHRNWFKHGTPRQMMVKAGGLVLAEIERLDRATSAAGEEVQP
ncbi:TPA: hypothetical protein NI607_005288 [Pseudomonas aeruginosa]|nr:hypothetical protein [Pseudomonas aeruginosa]HCF9261083.1 hypothetical protein [Pseudomonas aeruginosa]HCF9321745.1 hypothetical protein [Pseudomonas aeruginosa]HCF9391328.1 hypothetical protein [Pseudomonas aeruginosa]HCF9404287.1 hypothetical protein [Pseudomonas aeruginosa]